MNMNTGLVSFIISSLVLIGIYVLYLYYKLKLIELLIFSLSTFAGATNLMIFLVPQFKKLNLWILLTILAIGFVLLFVSYWYMTGFVVPTWVFYLILATVFLLIGLSSESTYDRLFPVFTATDTYIKAVLLIFCIFGLLSFVFTKIPKDDHRVNLARNIWISIFSIFVFALLGSFIYPSTNWLILIGITIPFLGYLIGFVPEGTVISNARIIKMVETYNQVIKLENQKKSFPTNYEEYINRVKDRLYEDI